MLILYLQMLMKRCNKIFNNNKPIFKTILTGYIPDLKYKEFLLKIEK